MPISLRPRLKKCLAEFIGSFAIVFIGCGSIIVSNLFPGSMSHLGISAIFGLVVAAMIYSIGHISGAHFNPAVTLGFAIGRHFPLKRIFEYWIAQISGATAGALLLKFIFSSHQVSTLTAPQLPFGASFLLEVLMSFFLMFVISSVATDTKAEGTMAGAAIGATVFFGSAFCGPLTGASMNPARSLGPALTAMSFEGLWIYLSAPFLGAALAALTYNFIREDNA